MEILLYSAFFALLCLDGKHAFQLAISQPLITSALIGFMLNSFVPAMYFGLIIQLIWLGNLPFGASKTPEGNIASIIGCWLYVEFFNIYEMQGQFLLLMIFIYIVIISFLASKAESYLRYINIDLFDYAFDSTNGSKNPNIGKVIFAALGLQFIANWAILIISIKAGQIFLGNLVSYLTLDLSAIWQYTEIAIWAAGIGSVISVYKEIKLKKVIALLSVLCLITIKLF